MCVGGGGDHLLSNSQIFYENIEFDIQGMDFWKFLQFLWDYSSGYKCTVNLKTQRPGDQC